MSDGRGFIETYFDNQLEFLDDAFLSQNELADCYLTEEELTSFLAPPQETWRDYLPQENFQYSSYYIITADTDV
jgi:hypothetical protein